MGCGHSLAGVWIEIFPNSSAGTVALVTPLRECGLKYKEVVLANDGDVSLPCGSVD